ncbi:MAG TPA: hypothetical protein ENO24_09815 [Chloroflexi bacterium]|nr:hypothetical protein [Chloroflexota bacterium]
MSADKKLTAIQKRAQNAEALAPFSLDHLEHKLPLVFPRDPDLPSSPKPHYRSAYRYLGFDDLEAEARETFSPFEIAARLFDYSHLEPLLAAHIYVPSAKGQVPFHPVSMYLLSLYRRERDLSRHEVLRILRHPTEGQALRRCTGFEDDFPSESGLRYFEGRITPELQQEINALQFDVLYRAGLLPIKPDAAEEAQAILSFDGMLHEARSHMRCSSAKASCYEPLPRPCPAKKKGKPGCDCDDEACADVCRHATPLDPDARFVVYTGNNKRAKTNPNTPVEKPNRRSRISRKVYGYYSYAGQLLADDLSTYWILPAAFGSATDKDPALFPGNFAYLQARFPWLNVSEVLADAGACEQTCLDAIWDAGALRMVDICANQADKDPDIRLDRGYDENGHPLCPFGYVLHSNGYDYRRRRAKWRCSKRCRHNSEKPRPECPYLKAEYKHGYTVTVGRAHADGTVRLAREIPYGSEAWKERYGRRNSAESRNSVLERLGLKRMPVHGQDACHVTVLQADFVANQRTLVRLIREATAG